MGNYSRGVGGSCRKGNSFGLKLLLSAAAITKWAIFGGLGLATIFYVISVCLSRRLVMPMEVILGLVANAMTLVTIACFMLNLGVHVLSRTDVPMSGAKLAAINVEGNEATAFFAFLYAFGMIAAAVRRNIISSCTRRAE